MVKVTLLFFLSLGTTSSKASQNLIELRQGPIEFRCDSMQVSSEPNQSICDKNVVVRRGDLLVCCSKFTGHANKDWEWTGFSCQGDIRAQRAGEISWAAEANFDLKSSQLSMTGKPLLKRGKSYLAGTEILLNVTTDRAMVREAHGRFFQNDNASPRYTLNLNKKLPSVCPLPPRPNS